MQASRRAKLTNRDVSNVLVGVIENALLPLSSSGIDFTPIETLSDEEVLDISKMMMDKKQSKRFSKLLDYQQARDLTPKEETELEALTQIYQELVLRKAQGLAEAIKRGLKESIV